MLLNKSSPSSSISGTASTPPSPFHPGPAAFGEVIGLDVFTHHVLPYLPPADLATATRDKHDTLATALPYVSEPLNYLRYAILNQQYVMVKQLVERHGINLTAYAYNLFSSLLHSRTPITEWLGDQQPWQVEMNNVPLIKTQRLLQQSIELGNYDLASQLVPDTNYTDLAIINNRPAILDYLMSQDNSPIYATYLETAGRLGYTAVLQTIVNKYQNQIVGSGIQLAILSATASGHWQLADWLMEHTPTSGELGAEVQQVRDIWRGILPSNSANAWMERYLVKYLLLAAVRSRQPALIATIGQQYAVVHAMPPLEPSDFDSNQVITALAGVFPGSAIRLLRRAVERGNVSLVLHMVSGMFAPSGWKSMHTGLVRLALVYHHTTLAVALYNRGAGIDLDDRLVVKHAGWLLVHAAITGRISAIQALQQLLQYGTVDDLSRLLARSADARQALPSATSDLEHPAEVNDTTRLGVVASYLEPNAVLHDSVLVGLAEAGNLCYFSHWLQHFAFDNLDQTLTKLLRLGHGQAAELVLQRQHIPSISRQPTTGVSGISKYLRRPSSAYQAATPNRLPDIFSSPSSPQPPSSSTINNQLALLRAIRQGDLNYVRNLNLANYSQLQLLDTAARHDQLEVFNYLLSYASPTYQTLFEAVINRSTAVTQQLIDMHDQLQPVTLFLRGTGGNHNYSPLVIVARYGTQAMLQTYLNTNWHVEPEDYRDLADVADWQLLERLGYLGLPFGREYRDLVEHVALAGNVAMLSWLQEGPSMIVESRLLQNVALTGNWAVLDCLLRQPNSWLVVENLAGYDNPDDIYRLRYWSS